MKYQTVFKRYELKYLITEEQKRRVIDAIGAYMKPDKYGRNTIRNIYFDTNDYRLIRHSIEKPTYKEKLRIRCYGQANSEDTVFVELKKKYKHVVYKRRVSLSLKDAEAWLCRRSPCNRQTQICEEINYFLDYYQTLHPTLFLSYNRQAYRTVEKSDFRVTFDDTVLCSREDFSFSSPAHGTPILPEGMVLMEIKCSGGIPLWMVRILSDEKIYKTSFSKYGTAYKTIIFPELQEVNTYA